MTDLNDFASIKEAMALKLPLLRSRLNKNVTHVQENSMIGVANMRQALLTRYA
ncbi:MAG TPA: hypothetical protein VGS16_00660 [Candidatus Dormibacteraeota bacterium]|nr:hypothetical protein [Candidatus Dormibacteraeota bacterium]